MAIREYARAVGKSFAVVHAMVGGYSAWLTTRALSGHSLTECIERAKVGADTETAIEAIARVAT